MKNTSLNLKQTHTIRLAQSEQEIENCWDVIKELRPHLQKENLVAQVKEMEQEGYRIAYVAVKENGEEKIVSFAGFRPMNMLFCGKIIYIDDLGTLPAWRGHGYAGQLLDYVHQLAKDTGKTGVHLDSGHHRSDAHRLYLNKKFRISAHHFTLNF
jgi:GNAT superfamily N-acetyltransferase